MGWDTDSLTGKVKAPHTSKAEQCTTSHRQGEVQPSPRQPGSITGKSDLGRQMFSL